MWKYFTILSKYMQIMGEAEDKAVEPVEVLLFLGIELDTNKMELV